MEQSHIDGLRIVRRPITGAALPDRRALGRAAIALRRAPAIAYRERRARARDFAAIARDLAATERDAAAERRETALQAEIHLKDAGEAVPWRSIIQLRVWLAQGRQEAADDRRQAAADRAEALDDRRQAQAETALAHLDELTGLYRRGLGEEMLRHEIARAQRLGQPFVLAYVDVDGLKAVNDRDGHAAGDALLRSVADAIRQNTRSYDPVVRVGGDEFVCGFAGSPEAALERLHCIEAEVRAGSVPGSISIGVAELENGDSLESLTARSDADLHRAKAAPALAGQA